MVEPRSHRHALCLASQVSSHRKNPSEGNHSEGVAHKCLTPPRLEGFAALRKEAKNRRLLGRGRDLLVLKSPVGPRQSPGVPASEVGGGQTRSLIGHQVPFQMPHHPPGCDFESVGLSNQPTVADDDFHFGLRVVGRCGGAKSDLQIERAGLAGKQRAQPGSAHLQGQVILADIPHCGLLVLHEPIQFQDQAFSDVFHQKRVSASRLIGNGPRGRRFLDGSASPDVPAVEDVFAMLRHEGAHGEAGVFAT